MEKVKTRIATLSMHSPSSTDIVAATSGGPAFHSCCDL
jgi:hypothetical protein